ncbi:NAD(P)/FAD-dependent oxidoreductase [Ruminococcaceae bacterium OttesenSCG-928-I18]|nr:NAD(P)/FAD-dependent oxidoreductase [Ruminococcaceae bacterium OttesenSCG-928-I18]
MEKVVIIGAGPAGLTAAYELLDSGKAFEVTVLEESNVLGGISKTVRFEGNRMDIGGHRFFSKDDRVMRWWFDKMPLQGAPALDDRILEREKPLQPGGPDPEQTDRVMLVRDRVSRIYYGGHFFDYPISMNFATIRNMGFLTTVKAGFSYLGSLVHKRPEDSLENFYINRFGKVLYTMFFEGYTEKLWGRHPRDISADWGAQRVKGLSIAAVLKDILRKIFPFQNAEVETSLIEQFYYPKLGPGQLWEWVGQEIERKGGRVLRGCRVDAITAEKGKIRSVGYTHQGERKCIEAEHCLSSMPVKDLVTAMQDVPPPCAEVAAGLPYRDFVTVGLLVPKLHLKNTTKMKTLGNIVPDCWIYVQEPSVKLGRIQIFNNWSPYMLEDPEHTVWVGLEYFCEEGDDFWTMEDADCIRFATEELIGLGILERGTVLKSHRERVKKAYPAYFDTYDRMGELVKYLDTFSNLYCIGRNGQHRYNNMDHSMATAFEAVQNIVEKRKEKANIWNVNTEKAYHEHK